MRLFVYGTLLSGEGNHRVHRGGRLIGVRRTEPRYTLVSLGVFPALLDRGSTSVAGDVYEVDDATLAAVERLSRPSAPVPAHGGVPSCGECVDGYVLVQARRGGVPVIEREDWRQHADRGRR